MFRLSISPIEIELFKQTLRDERAGAYVAFEGRVRNVNDGTGVSSLEYEGYEAVAVKEGERILNEAKAKFDIFDVQCVHRVGHLAIGDLAVWAGVIAGHRGEAFKACEYVIDEIKQRLPIWKKEHYSDGNSGWVNCQARPVQK